MTQKQLAAASGVGITSIEKYELGEQAMRPATLQKIAEAFNQRGVYFTNGEHPTVGLFPEKALIP